MIRKILKQNKVFFSIIVTFLLFFSLILYLGVNRIYESESKWQHGISAERLLSAKTVAQSFIAELQHHLLFLRELSSIRKYVSSNFTSEIYRTEVQNALFNLAKVSKEIYLIRIIDLSGRESVRIENFRDNAPVIVSPFHLQNVKHRDEFQEALKLVDKGMYFSPVDVFFLSEQAEKVYLPVINIAASLFDPQNNRKGMLIMTFDVSKIFQLVPENISIHTEEGNVMSKNPDGHVDFKKSTLRFPFREGRIELSDTQTIHYSSIDSIPGKRLVVALHHQHPGLREALRNLVLLAAILLAIFFCIIFAVSYIDISRVNEKNRAQKALIHSLVELTDWRDPETGHHLERTKGYSLELARQLQKNHKYRKIITQDFLEDISDAAPLHDVGKVGIKDSILLKEGSLTDKEFEEMKMHVSIGKQVLQDIVARYKITPSYIMMAKSIASYHHEKYNGKGYVEGLKKGEIPIEARIFALADVYDALRSKRPYKDEMTHVEASRIIKSESGEQFDPDIVEAFIRGEKEFLAISEQLDQY